MKSRFAAFRRWWFFRVEQLQITRRERISVMILILLITGVHGVNEVLRRIEVTPPESHQKLLEEFQERSRHTPAIERVKPESAPPLLSSADETAPSEKKEAPIPTVNINTADLAALERLPGIGRTYARRILEYREQVKGFRSVDELTRVKGIGPKTLEKLRPHITL